MNPKRRSEVILSRAPFHRSDLDNLQRYGQFFSFTISEGSTYILLELSDTSLL